MFGAAGLEELLKLQMTSASGSFSLIRADSSSIEGCVQALEEERRKIEAFRRELPMCMQLIADAIQALKNHSSRMPQSATSINLGCDAAAVYADDDHDKISSRKCFAEFIPSKSDESTRKQKQDIDADKPSWMSQAQLWTQSTTPKEKGSNAVRPQAQRIILSSKPGAFSPFIRKEQQQQQQQPPEAELTISSESQTPHSDESDHKLREATSNNNNSNGTAASKSTKARRCWSPELHRRFMNALKQLGGTQATPKQIREIMKVDGLTNDEVKSHLQKYRLHTRRPTAHSSERQVVVLGGIWVSPEMAAAAAAGQTIFDATSTTSFRRSALSPEFQKPKEEQQQHETREEVITKTTIQEQQRGEEMEDRTTTETEEEKSVQEQQTSSMNRSSEEEAN